MLKDIFLPWLSLRDARREERTAREEGQRLLERYRTLERDYEYLADRMEETERARRTLVGQMSGAVMRDPKTGRYKRGG